jgi:hypothetical protein
MMDKAEFKAPKGKYRVIGVDTFAHEDWVQEDGTDKQSAIRIANEKGGNMQKMHVYDDQGNHIHEAGTF